MAREKPPVGLLNIMELKFCDEMLAHGDKAFAVRQAGFELSLEDTPVSKADEMLERGAIKDYLLVMRTGTEDEKLEDTIARLEAIRREAWRQGDYKQAGLTEMQIADLKGWKIERQSIMTSHVDAADFHGMGTPQLMSILEAASVAGALEKHGVSLGADGTLVRLENKPVISEAVYSEVGTKDD